MRGHTILVKYGLTRVRAACPCSEWLAAIEVAVKPREVARADLETDPMPPPEDVTCRPQIDSKQIRLSDLYQLGFTGGFPISGTNDSIEKVLGVAVRMNIDEFRRKVGVDRRRGRPQGQADRSRDLDRLFEWIRGID